MFISEMVTERGLVFVRAITILTIHKLSMLVLVPNVSVNSSSMDPFFTVFTLNFASIYKKVSLTSFFKLPQVIADRNLSEIAKFHELGVRVP